MKPLNHLIMSSVVGFASYWVTDSVTIALTTVGTGVIIDCDHLCDYTYYLINKKKGLRSFNVKEFLESDYMAKTKKVIVPLHSYELLLPIWFLGIFFNLIPLAFWITFSFLAHVIADQIAYRTHPLAYFLIFRVVVRFKNDSVCRDG